MAEQNPAIAEAAKAAVGAVKSTAEKDTNNISIKSVTDAQPQLQAAIAKAIAATPEMQHVTNSEPWWTKRSRWGAIIGPVTLVLGLVLKAADVEYSFGLDQQNLLADALTAVGIFIASWFSYQAGVQTTPLGTPARTDRPPIDYKDPKH